jgi:hypothetical protein
MRTPEEVRLVGSLVAAGLNDCEITRRTGIPRLTVKDWRRGLRPNFDRYALWPPGSEPTLDDSAEPAYSYVLGMYLGDGDLSRLSRAYRLRITLDGIYPAIVAECKAALEAVIPNRVSVQPTSSRAVFVSAYSNGWPHLLPQHGPGPKHLRHIDLADWQRRITHRYPEALIRGLIHSDGCRNINTVRHPDKTYAYPRYQFSNRSDDIRAIFCEHLDLLGIPWRRMNRWNISVARREGVARLDEFVGPKR